MTVRFVVHTVVALTVCINFVASSYGHEGHQPLPSKGVQVDLERGRVVLSRTARDLIDVQTVEVEERAEQQHLRAYAKLVAPWNKHAFVTSRLSGQVASLRVQPGETVSAGQVIAELDSLDLHSLRLDYLKALNDIDLSTKTLEILEQTVKGGAISGQRVFELQLTHQQNLNRLKVLRSKVASLSISENELQESDSQPFLLPVVSPIGGIVLHSDLAVGKVVEPTEHLMEIVDLSTVWARIGVLERDWHQIALNQQVKLNFSGLPGKDYDSRVDRLGLMLDPLTHQSLVWAELKNPSDSTIFRPGMNGQAELNWKNQVAVLSVPTRAIHSDGAERFVLIEEALLKEGSEYQKVPVVLGRQANGLTEILSGKVLPGDQVVTQGGHQLASLFFSGVLRIGPETAKSIGLKIESTTRQVVENVLSLDASVDVSPDRRTSVSPQLAGMLQAIHVDRGQSVQQGDVLAEVSSLEFRDLQLSLLQAHLDGQLWRDTLTRRRTAGEGAVTKLLILETENQVTSFDIQISSLRQNLLTLGLTATQIDGMLTTGEVIDALPVRAPINGAIVSFDRALGQAVRADEALFEIHDVSAPAIQAFVAERDSSQIRIGQKARIRLVAYPDVELHGSVTRIGPVLGTDSRTHAAWIDLNERPSMTLQHNMSARVTLTTDRPSPTLAIPRGAVIRDGLLAYVFVQKPDGTFERRSVQPGRADDRIVEVMAGLGVGEPVAVGGVQQLQTAFAAVR